MKSRSGARGGRIGGGQTRRGGPARDAGGVEVKGEEGELVVPEGEDADGDQDGDDILEQPNPSPNPLFYPSPSGCKRPSGKIQRSAARQPPPPNGLPKFLNRAVG